MENSTLNPVFIEQTAFYYPENALCPLFIGLFCTSSNAALCVLASPPYFLIQFAA